MNRSILTPRRGAALVASAGLAASALAALPASATIRNVEDGHNVTVFHNIDFVAVSGWADDEPLTVTVRRGSAVIGTASGAASDPEETGSSGLEVNHGPEVVPPNAGDCWTGHTPDIRPGDRISVSNGTLTDTVIVDNIAFTSQPFKAPNGDVLVEGVARRAGGRAIPLTLLDSAEFRDGSDLRIFANRIRMQRRAGVKGGFTMRYVFPFRTERNRNNLSPQQIQRRLLSVDGHAIGFGHVDPLPPEAMLYEGLTDTPGPAPGCEEAPSAQWAVANVTPGAINRTNRADGLTIRGLAADAESVRVALSDNDPTTSGAPVRTVTPTAAGRWTATFGKAQLRGLNRRIRVATTFTLADGSFTDRSTTLVKDLKAPRAPRASAPSGRYDRALRVALRSAKKNKVRYTLGDGSQAKPTARSGAVYRGKRIRISASQVLKAVAIDPAGNVSRVGRFRYRIR